MSLITALYLAMVFALGLPANAPRLAVSQLATVNRDSLVTSMVDVDGLSIRVRSSGLMRRDPRTPVVVFESGGGAPFETWDAILPTVSTFAPVVAYDRAGTGQSAWDSLPPTPERVVARARRLLVTLNAAPPFVLVGHSWGGPLIRYFGGRFPADVVGVLYIDPTDITQSPADEVQLYESIGSNAAGRDAFYNLMARAMAGAPAPMRAEGVVTPSGLPFDTKRYADAVQQHRSRRLRDWVREPGEFLVATNSGHMIHINDPELVIGAIRRLSQRR